MFSDARLQADGQRRIQRPASLAMGTGDQSRQLVALRQYGRRITCAAATARRNALPPTWFIASGPIFRHELVAPLAAGSNQWLRSFHRFPLFVHSFEA